MTFTITENALTRAFSWLKMPTKGFHIEDNEHWFEALVRKRISQIESSGTLTGLHSQHLHGGTRDRLNYLDVHESKHR